MNQYEINILFTNQEKEFQVEKEFVNSLFKEQGVEIYDQDDTGTKDLAYPIKKYTSGHYYYYHIKASPEKIKVLSKELSLREKILRYMFVQLDKKAIKHFEEMKKRPKPRAYDSSSEGSSTVAPSGTEWKSPSRRTQESVPSNTETSSIDTSVTPEVSESPADKDKTKEDQKVD